MTPAEKLQAYIQKGCERHAWDHGTCHTKRTEPAWHYSIIDAKAGAQLLAPLLLKALEALKEVYDSPHEQSCNYVMTGRECSCHEIIAEKALAEISSAMGEKKE